MIVYALLLFVVRCWGIQWKTINDFEETIEVYTLAAVNTISSIENILDTSKSDSESFLNITYSDNSVLKKITEMRLSNDKCSERFIDEDKLKVSFENQTHQLQIPLQTRIVDIQERLNKINSSIYIYRWLAESKFERCQSESEGCIEKINEWLESTLRPLFRTVHPDCDIISISNSSLCTAGQFACKNSQCIASSMFCDGECKCGECSDEHDCEHCKEPVRACSPACGRKGGVCFKGPKGFECLDECPPETYETSHGCTSSPETPFATLAQVLEDTPRLTTRYAARMTHLKTAAVKTLSKSLEEVLKCKKHEYTSIFKDIHPSITNLRKLSADGSFMTWRVRNEAEHPIREKEDTVTTPTETTITPMNSEEESFLEKIGDESGNVKNKVTETSTSTETTISFRNAEDGSPGRKIGDESGNDKNKATEASMSSGTTKSFRKAEEESFSGKIGGESGNDKNKATETSMSTETTISFRNAKEGNSGWKIGGESGNDKNKATETSMSTETTISFRSAKEGNSGWKIGGESGNDKNKATETSMSTETTLSFQNTKDGNSGWKIGGEPGNDINKATETSMSTETTLSFQNTKDGNSGWKIGGESGNDKNKATGTSMSTETTLSFQNTKDGNSGWKIGGESGNNKNKDTKTSMSTGTISFRSATPKGERTVTTATTKKSIITATLKKSVTTATQKPSFRRKTKHHCRRH